MTRYDSRARTRLLVILYLVAMFAIAAIAVGFADTARDALRELGESLQVAR